MACIFNSGLLDRSAAMTDSFEERGAYSRGLVYWRIYGIRGEINRGNTVDDLQKLMCFAGSQERSRHWDCGRHFRRLRTHDYDLYAFVGQSGEPYGPN